MSGIRRILVATDFSPHAARAVREAVVFAKAFSARIDLIHACKVPGHPVIPDRVVMPQGFWDEVREAAGDRLDSIAEEIRDQGVPVQAHVLTDPASVAIVDMAAKLESDLIVVGSRGLTGLEHVMLGSVAERVVRTASCRVLTVK